MRSLRRVSVAMPIVGDVDPEAVVPVFHDWIREAEVDGLLIDVARYGHVHHGPGILLIGHEGDYSIDLAGGRASLRYTLKRGADGTPAELVALALRRLARAADVIAGDGVVVDRSDVTVRVYDRLRAPTTPESARGLTDEIVAGVRDAAGGDSRVATSLSDDPREPFGVRVRAA